MGTADPGAGRTEAIELAALHERVEVLWDRWGVPHIYARDVHDLHLAQGYVIASQRLFQMDVWVRMATGRLAEMFGATALASDRFVRTIDLAGVARAQRDGLDARSASLLAAWVVGVRASIAGMAAPPVEYELLDLAFEDRQFDELGFLTVAAMVGEDAGSAGAKLLRASVIDQVGPVAANALFPNCDFAPWTSVLTTATGTGHTLDPIVLAAMPLPFGSNCWAVDGSRSASGRPMLSNDPHQPAVSPAQFFECHLSCPDFEVSGVAVCYLPGIVIGHTRTHAWGFTNVVGDSSDLFAYEVSADRSTARIDGAWTPLPVRHEHIRVRGGVEEELVVHDTPDGPLLEVPPPGVTTVPRTETTAFAYRRLTGIFAPSALYDMAAATDSIAFQAATRGLVAPSINVIYVDSDGVIAYQCTGRFPIRRGFDGSVPVPAGDVRFIWVGEVPFEQLPSATNPEDGLLLTANNQIHGDDYPYPLSRNFAPPFRAARIRQLLEATDKHTVASFRAMLADTVSLPALRVAAYIVGLTPLTDAQRNTQALFANWSGDLTARSVPATIYAVWCTKMAAAVLQPQLGPELTVRYGRRWEAILPELLEHPTPPLFASPQQRDAIALAALDETTAELQNRLGAKSEDWRWGRLHLFPFPSVLGQFGRPEPEWMQRRPVEVGGDNSTICNTPHDFTSDYRALGGPTWRQLIDLAEVDAATGVMHVGNSGDPRSPHWGDQTALWTRGEFHALPLARDAVVAITESLVVLSPAHRVGA
jgi:penicillin G amidase